jgi:ABC-2 type transport system permease protein
MSGLSVLLRKEFLEQWRTLRFQVVAAVFVLIGLSSPLLARFTPEILAAVGGSQFHIVLPPPSTVDAVDQLLKNLGQLGAVIAILLPMGAVAAEKERGTGALLLTKPAGRGAFLVSKVVALAATLGAGVALASVGAWFYTLVLFEALPPVGFAAAALLEWLSLLAVASITFLGSTLTRSPLVAGGLGFVGFIVFGLVSVLPAIGRYSPVALATPAHQLALGQPADALGPTVATLLVVVVFGLASWLAFRRQEL